MSVENSRPALTQWSEDEVAFREAVRSFAETEIKPHVNHMDDGVAPHSPVELRDHVGPVPRSTNEPCTSAGKCFENELAADRFEETVEVRRPRAVPQSPFAHWIGRRSDAESELARWIPDLDRLHE